MRECVREREREEGWMDVVAEEVKQRVDLTLADLSEHATVGLHQDVL